MDGWIKLHRQIQDNIIWQEKPFHKALAWIDLLLLANHKDKKVLIDNEVVIIERGQLHTSILKLADRWGWNRKTVSSFLNLLENEEMITQKRTARGTTLTIVNYGFYQNDGTTDGTSERTPEGTTPGQPNGQLWDSQTDTNKNIKNYKNDKNEKNEKNVKKFYGTFGNVQLTDTEYEKLKTLFPGDYEEKINTLSEYMTSKGKTYKSHYATILNWDRMDKKKQDDKQRPSAYMEAIRNRVDVVDSWI